MGDLLSSNTVNVNRRPDSQRRLNREKLYLLIVIVLLAVILHKQNIAQVGCKTRKITKRSKSHSSIRLLALNSPVRLNEHIPDDYYRVVHVD